MDTKELAAVPLTRREARYLMTLADAAKEYRRTLENLRGDVQREQLAINAGRRISGLGHQDLAQVSASYGAVQALVGAQFYARDMNDTGVWEELFAAAYTGALDWFEPAE
jgi:hypothetical protein